MFTQQRQPQVTWRQTTISNTNRNLQSRLQIFESLPQIPRRKKILRQKPAREETTFIIHQLSSFSGFVLLLTPVVK